MNGHETKIEDPAELAQVRRQARRVHIKAVLSGIVLTLLMLPIPAGSVSNLLRRNKRKAAGRAYAPTDGRAHAHGREHAADSPLNLEEEIVIGNPSSL